MVPTLDDVWYIVIDTVPALGGVLCVTLYMVPTLDDVWNIVPDTVAAFIGAWYIVLDMVPWFSCLSLRSYDLKSP